ncbi:NADH-quinone oxidoreductase subunit NuoE family protein [Sphingomonas sp. TDK1]|uniref:NADH-quinone oxidoreductase subunit NuoE family protein n=1 Tax=Sphingomonas sp. TDK1 TaxID=453247 RepID=UPI0007DA270F|nr:NAD(P)H-dependent oxidoreductase subunit E [Sphingomonas sp. TDK1]OAN58521.1 NADH-quinone oxidoreductase subunit E [Sphingomonas sp. TDK1]
MADLDDILHAHPPRQDALLPILHDVQAAFGHVSEAAIRTIAQHLNLSRAEVSGVVSFYHDFRRTPDPRPAIKLCRAESCQARGSDALAAEAERVAGGRVRVETVYCLGLCSVGPNAMVGDAVHARLDGGKVAALIGAL